MSINTDVSVNKNTTNYPICIWVIWLFIAIVLMVGSICQAKRSLFSDVATHVMISSSVWHDFDLKYSLADLARFRADFPAESGPRGVFLKTSASGDLFFAKPYIYGAVTAPFYGFAGVDGFIIFNSICLFVIGLISTLALRSYFGTVWGMLASVGFVLPGPFLAWISVPHPDLFIAALLASAGYLMLSAQATLSWRGMLGAAVLAVAIHEKPVFIMLLPFLVLAMPAPRSLSRYAVLVGVTAASWLALSLPNLFVDGTLLAYQGNRLYVPRSPFPLEEGWIAPTSAGGITGHVFSPFFIAKALISNLALIPEKFSDFVIGRQTGILVYFPMALILLLVGTFFGKVRGLWLIAGFFAYLGLNWLAFPTNGYGGSGSYGPRYMMQGLPLIPLSLMRFQATRPSALSTIWKFLLIAASCAAVTLHFRAFVPNNQLVQFNSKWFVQRPLNNFPIENWLLPFTAGYIPGVYEKSASRPEVIFDKARIDNQASSWGVPEKKNVVLFQHGDARPFGELELWPTDASELAIIHGRQVLWQGKQAHGQPLRVSLGKIKYDSEAFDLLSKDYVRFVELEVISNGRAEHEVAPILRFAQESKTFAAYGHELTVAEFVPQGISLVRGWSHLEPWGVWSNDKLAQLILHTGKYTGAYELVVRMHAYVTPEDPVRKVRLFANGRPLDELEFRAGDGNRYLHYRFRTEPGEEYINLGFEIRNPVSPYMLGKSGDMRMLGVGLLSMKLERISGDGE